MPAKSYTDIPDDAKVQIRHLTDRKPKEVWIEAVDNKGELYHREGADRPLMGIKAEIIVEPKSGKEAWRVTHSFAEKGFGPLVYDILMELASSDDRIGLLTGTGLTQESQYVWKYYLENRKDVIRTPVDDGFLKSVSDKEFPFVWRKEAKIFPLLEAAGKIERIEGEADILASIDYGTLEEDEQVNKLFETNDETDEAK